MSRSVQHAMTIDNSLVLCRTLSQQLAIAKLKDARSLFPSQGAGKLPCRPPHSLLCYDPIMRAVAWLARCSMFSKVCLGCLNWLVWRTGYSVSLKRAYQTVANVSHVSTARPHHHAAMPAWQGIGNPSFWPNFALTGLWLVA